MQVVLSLKAQKQYDKLNEPIKSRIKAGLDNLEKDPPQGDITTLEGRNGYRLRIGGYRVVFDKMPDNIAVYDIGTRGGAYKGSTKK